MEQPQAMLGPDYSLDCFKQTMTMALFTDALGLGLRNDIRLNRFLNLEIGFLRVRNSIDIRINSYLSCHTAWVQGHKNYIHDKTFDTLNNN